MSNTIKIIKGEMKRLITYKILPVSLATSLLWIILFLFISKEEAKHITPLLIFVDVTMMAILLIGASNHLEKQDGTIKTMMVLPVSITQILTSKILSSMVLGLESAVITSAALYFIHGVTYNYALLLMFVVIAVIVHAAIGFFLSLISKDFSTMLGLLMAYTLPFTIPTLLFSFGIINVKYEWILMISPSHSSGYLISAAVYNEFDYIKVIFACLYLVILAIVLFRFIVYPRFKSNAVRG